MRFAPAAVVCVALLTSGCGFHPLYGDHGATAETTEKLSSIFVEPISNRLGYEMRNTLIDLFNGSGRSGGAAYRLHVTISEKSEGVAVQNDAAITRYNDTLTVRYVLTDTQTNKLVTQGTENGLSAYNVVASPYATLAAQRDSDKRAAEDIAERIRINLSVYFAQHNTPVRR